MGNGDDKSRKQSFSFNISGNKLEEIVQVGGVIEYKNTCKYSGKKLISETIFNKNIKPSNIVKKYSYDSRGRILQVKIVGPGNKLIQNLEYNHSSKVTSVREYQANSRLKSLTVFTYGPGNLLLSEVSNDSVRIEYLYNKAGRKIKRDEYKNDQLYYTVDYSYDNRGNILSETSQYIGGTTTVLNYYYQYDKKGNWITMREQMNGTTYAISTREISYYPSK